MADAIRTNWDARDATPDFLEDMWGHVAPAYSGNVRCAFWVKERDTNWRLSASIRVHGLKGRVSAAEHLDDFDCADTTAIVGAVEALDRLKTKLMQAIVAAGGSPYLEYVGDGTETDEEELEEDATRAEKEDNA